MASRTTRYTDRVGKGGPSILTRLEEKIRLSAVLSPQENAAPRAWRELWLITIGHGLTHWYPATFYLLLPLIGAELGLSYSQIGLIMTCKYIASAVANVPGGVLAGKVGGQRPVIG